MFLKRQGPRPWVWTEAVESAVDFCVWVLLADGLLVPPFDRHSGGSGSLRVAGLDVSNWRAWLARVVAAQQALSRQVRDVGNLSRMTDQEASDLAGQLERSRPARAWVGPEAVRETLDSLWTTYAAEGEAWQQRLAEPGGPAALTPRDRGRIWQQISPGRESGEVLTVYVVRYPTPVVDVVWPGTLVLAMGHERGSEAYLRLLREGIARSDDARPRVKEPDW